MASSPGPIRPSVQRTLDAFTAAWRSCATAAGTTSRPTRSDAPSTRRSSTAEPGRPTTCATSSSTSAHGSSSMIGPPWRATPLASFAPRRRATPTTPARPRSSTSSREPARSSESLAKHDVRLPAAGLHRFNHPRVGLLDLSFDSAALRADPASPSCSPRLSRAHRRRRPSGGCARIHRSEAEQCGRRRHGRSRARPDRRVLARRQLPLGRPDLPARQPAAARAAAARARQAAAARALGHDARAQLRLRAPEPRHPGARPRRDLRHRARPRRPGPGRQRVPRGHLQRGLPARSAADERRAARGCSASSPSRAASRATSRPRRPARSTRAASSATRSSHAYGAAFDNPDLLVVLRRRRRRGRDRAAGHELALEQVPRPGARRRGAADPAPQRLQDRQPDASWRASRATS